MNDLRTEGCAKCGVPLFETIDGSNYRKIFRSFATKSVNDVELHFCIDCYKQLNNKFEEEKQDEMV